MSLDELHFTFHSSFFHCPLTYFMYIQTFLLFMQHCIMFHVFIKCVTISCMGSQNLSKLLHLRYDAILGEFG